MKTRILVLLLTLALCLGCAQAETLPAAGEYTLFAVETEGFLVQSDTMELASVLRLDAGGTGYMTFNDDGMDITQWSAEGAALTITMADGGSAGATLDQGVLALDLYGNGAMILYFALPQADLSAYHPLTLEELRAAMTPTSRLFALYETLDTAAGLHMRYDVDLEYMNAHQSYDVHTKGGVYYSHRTSRVASLESGSITFFKDGAAYNLDPEKHTGVLVTTTSSSAITDNVMRMDRFYAAISANAQRTDVQQETREVDGAAYAVEFFPAQNEYESDAAFYFDQAGSLRYYQEINPTLGESFYTLLALDGAVDESLFDISGYAIQ